jgi:hypothetical protein
VLCSYRHACILCAPALANINTRCKLMRYLYLQQLKRRLHDANELNKDQAIHINKVESETAQLTLDLYNMFGALVLSKSKVCTHIARHNIYKSTNITVIGMLYSVVAVLAIDYAPVMYCLQYSTYLQLVVHYVLCSINRQ